MAKPVGYTDGYEDPAIVTIIGYLIMNEGIAVSCAVGIHAPNRTVEPTGAVEHMCGP